MYFKSLGSSLIWQKKATRKGGYYINQAINRSIDGSIDRLIKIGLGGVQFRL